MVAAMRIALAYLLAGTLWILMSDWMLEHSPASGLMLGQTSKGLLFVVLSSALIYVLTLRAVRAVRRTEAERDHLDRRLTAVARLESLGQLTGGIAHDFNNLLTAISGNLDLHLAGHPDETGPELREARKSADRAAHLTRQLLAVGRYRVARPERVDVTAVVSDLSDLLHRLIGDRVRIRKELDEQLPPVVIDPGRLEQVVMNLAINARDAMPDGGQLCLRTCADEASSSPSLPRRGETPASLPPGRYVRIDVTDTGVGMDEETRARIFDPFFTTKPEDAGTGLGLSTVRAIVQEASGLVRVASAPGAGTTFSVFLPAARGAASNKPSGTPESPAAAPAGAATVLVAEDDAAVRSLVCRVLERHGYGVVTAPDGPEALEALRDRSSSIDLLLSDAAMPEMPGPELLEMARELRPGLPVLLMSGHGKDEVGDGVPYLAKPFTPAELVRRVGQALEGEALKGGAEP